MYYKTCLETVHLKYSDRHDSDQYFERILKIC